MKSVVFREENNKVVFFPRKLYLKKNVWHTFLIFIVLLSILYLITYNIQKSLFWASVGAALAMPLVLLRAFILSKTQIIFDIAQRQVVRKSVFRERVVTSFDQISEIRLISPCLFVSDSQFILLMKNDVYGDGVTLSYLLEYDSPMFEDLKNNAIAKLEALIFGNDSYHLDTDDKVSIRLFNETRKNYYIYSKQNYFALGFVIVCFILVAYLACLSNLNSLVYWVPLLFSALIASTFGHKMFVDVKNKTIGVVWWNLKETKCRFDEIELLDVVRTSARGFESHEIFIDTSRLTKPFRISLVVKKDSKRITQLMKEIDFLIHQ